MLSASCSRLACWSLRWSCFSPWLEEQPVRNRFTMDLAAFLVSVGDDHARGRPIGQFPRRQGRAGRPSASGPKEGARSTCAGAQSRKCSWIRRMVCRSAINAMTRIGPAHFGRTAGSSTLWPGATADGLLPTAFRHSPLERLKYPPYRGLLAVYETIEKTWLCRSRYESSIC